MESIEKIRALLDKFYRGETDLEEEKSLRDYFTSEDVAGEFMPDRELFLSFEKGGDSIRVPGDLNQKIIASIDRAEHQAVRTRRISLFSMSGLAAGLLVVIAVYLFFIRTDQNPRVAASELTDTYDNPMDAYMEAKKTLAYVSAKLNEGTNDLNYVKDINKATGPIQSLSKINKGTKELSLLGQLQRVRDLDRQ